MTAFDTDVFIIGGGINGVGIARDAAGRGYDVTMCEKGDLASGTSSASTKLIHGGLRYLEHYEFNLVRAALNEREVLMAAAPHIITPMRFILPQSPGVRPAWLIRLGLFLYDHLGKRKKLPSSGNLKLKTSPYGVALNPSLKKASYYSDCWVDDSRLVVLNARDAAERGARIFTYTTCVSAEPNEQDGGWNVRIRDNASNREKMVRAKTLVNAAGPWAAGCLSHIIDRASSVEMRLVKGSHIVVPKMFDHDSAYIFQNPDRRIVFAIPYLNDYTMIGTTDEDYTGALNKIAPSQAEIDYLCETSNRFFQKPITEKDIIWKFAGVRPLLGGDSTSAEEVTRDYKLAVQKISENTSLLSVLGGKITTYRKLAEQAVDKLDDLTGRQGEGGWTAKAPLTGGDIPSGDLPAFIQTLCRQYAWLPADVVQRYATSYGTEVERVIGEASSIEGMGHDFGYGLYGREIAYLMDREWAKTAEDILWRRTKLGVSGGDRLLKAVSQWMSEHQEKRVNSPTVFKVGGKGI